MAAPTPLKVVKNIAESAVLLFAVVAVVLALAGKIFGLNLFTYVPMWVITDSMEDTIPAQSYILVQYIDASAVEQGDVITFHSPDPALGGQLNTHRVVEIIGDNEAFITQGDAFDMADEFSVSADRVVAKYVRNLPVLTFFGRLFVSRTGLVVFFILILLMVAAWFFVDARQKKRKAKQQLMDELVSAEVARLEEENREK